MADAILEDREVLDHHQVPQAWVLAALIHLGLLAIGLSAVRTVQPGDFGLRRWAPYVLVACGGLVYAGLTRGRGAFQSPGKMLTALLTAMALSLSYEPQLSNVTGLGERLPQWLADLAPGLGTVGALWATVWGLVYLSTIHRHHRARHEVPLVWSVLIAAGLVVVLGVGSFLGLGRLYEVDRAGLFMLLSQAVQYGLLTSVMLGLSGRIGIGSGPAVYTALCVLGALVHSLRAGGST